ncbi:hypothetical protein EHZ19_02380 [Paraburkholderia bannensis]|uniref:Uncharacterized protein n=1 Tax=Paraburkholderia tropica TaxID=92647 RepID=A0AAQ1GD73_9BURK|nr:MULTISPECIES: hypothetical protein [Paraburkholderia]RQM50998.1 hypothetical protein EHZ19_02380 [Paraburkholderia bannensis]RQN40271.1 hypothetical protein EHZ25_02485 [Paraburkholderia tropica]SEJ32238.1 hypothetical protein SAMN05216550_1044 [Paraburkholderia tropica]
MTMTRPPDRDYPEDADGADAYAPPQRFEEAVSSASADPELADSSAVEDDRSKLVYHAGIARAQMDEIDQTRAVLQHQKGLLATMFGIASFFALFFALALAAALGVRIPLGIYVPASAVGVCAALASFSIVVATLVAYSLAQTDILAFRLRGAYAVRKAVLFDLNFQLGIHVEPDDMRYRKQRSRYGE